MKLKYYLRGLGIGIAVTAVVLSASDKGHIKELTDAQIKVRAKELGMVEESLLSDVLDDNAEKKVQVKSTQEDSAGNNSSISDNSSISNNSAGSKTYAADDKQSVEKKADTIKKIAEDANQKEAVKKVSEEQNIDSKTGAGQKEATVVIAVKSGESSALICKKLEKEGLIDSASEFDQYLCQNGYDKRICTGEHSIKKGATKEEIAKEITSK